MFQNLVYVQFSIFFSKITNSHIVNQTIVKGMLLFFCLHCDKPFFFLGRKLKLHFMTCCHHSIVRKPVFDDSNKERHIPACAVTIHCPLIIDSQKVCEILKVFVVYAN